MDFVGVHSLTNMSLLESDVEEEILVELGHGMVLNDEEEEEEHRIMQKPGRHLRGGVLFNPKPRTMWMTNPETISCMRDLGSTFTACSVCITFIALDFSCFDRMIHSRSPCDPWLEMTHPHTQFSSCNILLKPSTPGITNRL